VVQCKLGKPVFLICVIIAIVSVACAGRTGVTTPTPITPKPSLTRAPSYTPFPTYTPKSTSTRPPTDTPSPTSTSLHQISPTEGITSTAPVNCVPATTDGYNTCIDNSGILQVDLPKTWPEVNGSTWTYSGHDIGVAISAAPNLTAFQNSFMSEGVFFGASGAFAQIYGHIELLDFYTLAYRENCLYIGRFNYDDGVYRGKYDQYQKCGGQDGYDAYILGARDKTDPSTKLILIEIQAIPGDLSIRDKIWSTFFVYF
jgi:hypothetical protein